MATGSPRKAGAAVAIAILFTLPTLQSGSSLVNIAYGRSWPRSIVIDSGRQRAYIDGISGIFPPDGFSFGVVYLGNGSIGKVLGLPGTPGELALDASTRTVYVSGQNFVAVVDALNMTVERTITLKIPVFSMVFDNSTGDLLLTSGNKVFQLDPASGRLLRNATVGQAAEGMAVDTAAGVVFVANYLSSSISVLRSADLTLVKTIQIPSPAYPSKLSLDTKRGVLYATTDEQSVVRVSSTTYAVIGSITVSGSSQNGTYDVAVDPVKDRLFVATEPGTTISEVNATTGGTLSTFTVYSQAYELVVDQATGTLYVTNYHQITAYTPADVFRPATSMPERGLLALLVLVPAALVVYALVRKFRSNGGRRGGPDPLPRTGRSWSPWSPRPP